MATDPVTELQKMLARVRPVGMTDSAARDWLAVAVSDVRHLSPVVLAAACEEAKRSVKFHSEIIPAILNSEIVRGHERHERMVAGLLRDGHHIPGRSAPQIEHQRGVKRIGQVVQLEDYRDEA